MENKILNNGGSSKMKLKRNQKISAGIKMKELWRRRKLITINITMGETCIPKGAAYFSSGLCIRFTLPHGFHVVKINDHFSIVKQHRGGYTFRSKSSQACFPADWEVTLMAFGIQISHFVCLLWSNVQEEKLKEKELLKQW